MVRVWSVQFVWALMRLVELHNRAHVSLLVIGFRIQLFCKNKCPGRATQWYDFIINISSINKMTTSKFKIPRISDQSLVDVFIRLIDTYDGDITHWTALGDITFNGTSKLKNTFDQILKFDAHLICALHLRSCGLSIRYSRGGGDSISSPVYDEIQIESNSPPDPAGVDTRLALVDFLQKELRQFEIGVISTSEASPEINQVLAIHQSNLVRLEKLNEDLIKENFQFRSDVEKKFEDKVTLSEEMYVKKQVEADSRQEIKELDFQRRELELAEKLKIIDDRNNTHVRREIRDRMLDDVKERIARFGVSEATERKRMPVAIGILSLIFVTAVLVFFTLFEIQNLGPLNISVTSAQEKTKSATISNSTATQGTEKAALIQGPDKAVATQGADKPASTSMDRSAIYWLWGRLSILSLSLLASILYYIKWQNKWAEQHAASEFQLQQFYVDVNRANWVIESCLEWRKDTDSIIPTELLSSITNGLFFNPLSEQAQIIHPADELASALLGSASKLKLNVGDNTLEFDKPGKIRPSLK
jgi:hypothetical protein